VVGTPDPGTNVHEGQSGRYTLGGTWYFRQDHDNVGVGARYFAQADLAGWTPVDIPNVWNGRDYTENRSSVGWYRKEFRIPRRLCVRRERPEKPKDSARSCDRFSWRVAFLGANHEARVWLNGVPIGRHSGGYLPFELPLAGLREGRNTLTVRVSTLRGRRDLTHWRAARYNGYGTGGWWNFGGLQREVWLRRIDGLDIQALDILPRLPKLKGPARVETVIRVRPVGAERQRVRLSLVLTDRKRRRTIDVGERVLDPGVERDVRAEFTIDNPRLWQLRRGALYGLRAVAEGVDRRGDPTGPRSSYRAKFGVRQIQKLSNGRVKLNGQFMRLRGASIHEDDPRLGSAWQGAQRKQALRSLGRLGATVTRAHYPLHPAMLEMLDRAGILVWNQAPVYQLPNSVLAEANIRDAALETNREVVEANLNHPSIFVWSIANELGAEPSEVGAVPPGQGLFIRRAVRLIRHLDDTRLVAIDRHSRVGEPQFHAPLTRLDAIGVNEYFGWYAAAAPGLPDSRTEDLLPFLDELHRGYPHTALFITEYGAESSRNGPTEEKGTYEFQNKWMYDHAILHGARSYINGSIVWALKDFRVHPDWGGGNWIPAPPWNNKGLVHEEGAPKPAFYVLANLFRRTAQLR
jgi:beta-glucuronidase